VDDLDRLLIYIVIGTLVGARLGHCLFYDPVYYLTHPLKILAIWEGGLASHGGGAGILLSLYIYQKKTIQSFLEILDYLAIPVALAGCFIRTGNFFNSEIIGIPASVPWAVVFERIDSVPRHPAQLYEAVTYLIIGIILLTVYYYTGLKRRGRLLGIMLILIFTARMLIEFVKENQAAFSFESGINMGQLLSIPFILAGIILVIWSKKYRRPV
jgi:prolipoprotein diacylglyceryl transferase